MFGRLRRGRSTQTFKVKDGALARMGDFEFNDDETVLKTTEMYEESVVGAALASTSGCLYP